MSRLLFLSVFSSLIFVSSIFAQQAAPSSAPVGTPADSSFTAVCLRSVSGTSKTTAASQKSTTVDSTGVDTTSFTYTCLRSVKNTTSAQKSGNTTTTGGDTIPSFTATCLGSVKNTTTTTGK
jgi:hypothetical protein